MCGNVSQEPLANKRCFGVVFSAQEGFQTFEFAIMAFRCCQCNLHLLYRKRSTTLSIRPTSRNVIS